MARYAADVIIDIGTAKVPVLVVVADCTGVQVLVPGSCRSSVTGMLPSAPDPASAPDSVTVVPASTSSEVEVSDRVVGIGVRATLVTFADRGRAALTVARRAEAELYAAWEGHLGKVRTRQLREALEKLREIADPYA